MCVHLSATSVPKERCDCFLAKEGTCHNTQMAFRYSQFHPKHLTRAIWIGVNDRDPRNGPAPYESVFEQVKALEISFWKRISDYDYFVANLESVARLSLKLGFKFQVQRLI